jgi:hypothetical protein
MAAASSAPGPFLAIRPLLPTVQLERMGHTADLGGAVAAAGRLDAAVADLISRMHSAFDPRLAGVP